MDGVNVDLCRRPSALSSIYLAPYIRNNVYSIMLTTLTALAEPTRLRIVELLQSSPRYVGEIEKVLVLNQPQVSKHLRVLREAGVVESTVVAQRRLYELRRQPFQEMAAWLEGYRRSWEGHLDALEAHLEQIGDDQ